MKLKVMREVQNLSLKIQKKKNSSFIQYFARFHLMVSAKSKWSSGENLLKCWKLLAEFNGPVPSPDLK